MQIEDWNQLNPMQRTAIMDLGNGRLKATLIDGRPLDIIHRMAFLTDQEYEHALARHGGKPGPYLMKVTPPGGVAQAIIVGEEALSYNLVSRPRGAARYVREYYGFLFINMLARLLPFNAETYAFVSHAPRDFNYRKDQKNAIRGEWIVEVGKQQRVYAVRKVWNFDEPYGGWANLAMCPDGSRNEYFTYHDARGLVLDVGDVTTDAAVVNPGGLLDTALIDSAPLGISDSVRDAGNAIRSKHAKLLQNSGLSDMQIYEAIRTGVLHHNGYSYDCMDEVRPAMMRLANGIRDYVRERVGGFGDKGYVAFTGGGGAMTMPYMLNNMDGFNTKHVMSVVDHEHMTVANALGGGAIWNFGVASGAVR